MTLSRRITSHVSACVAALLCLPVAAFASGVDSYDVTRIEAPSRRAGFLWAKMNRDELFDLLIVNADRFEIRYQVPEHGFAGAPVQTISPPVSGGLFDLSDLDGDGFPEIVLLHGRAAWAYAFDAELNLFGDEPRVLVDRLRSIPYPHLASADFVFDIDSDGDEDLIVPFDGKYSLYFQENGEFTRSNQIATAPISISVTAGGDSLRDRVSGSISVPRLQFEDISGDGRLDLHVSKDDTESFYLQSAEGHIPEEPTFSIDLARFRPPEPDSALDLNTAQFQFVAEDLDGDGMQDYAILSGNKIRLFKGGPEGADFDKPTQILKVQAESMNIAFLPLNDEPKPDLLIIKYDIPSIGRLVASLAIGLRFEVDFLGYHNNLKGGFSTRPDQRSTMIFKIPPILKLLGDIESITKDFEAIGERVQRVARGDMNGDGLEDILMLEGDSFDVYLSDAEHALPSVEDFGDGEFIRETIFGEKKRQVTLDTVLSFASDIVSTLNEAAITERAPSFSLPVDPELAEHCLKIACQDLNADGLDDIVLFTESSTESDDELLAEEIFDPSGPAPQAIGLWLSRP